MGGQESRQVGQYDMTRGGSTIRKLAWREVVLSALVLGCLQTCVLLVLWTRWGDGQECSVDKIRKTLVPGMSYDEVVSRVAGVSDYKEIERIPGGYYLILSRRGVGVEFSRQHTIRLYFSELNKLNGGSVEYGYQMSESAEALW